MKVRGRDSIIYNNIIILLDEVFVIFVIVQVKVTVFI